jgi:hypothetical protein
MTASRMTAGSSLKTKAMKDTGISVLKDFESSLSETQVVHFRFILRQIVAAMEGKQDVDLPFPSPDPDAIPLSMEEIVEYLSTKK